MKDLSDVTKMSPNHRRDVIKTFVKEVQSNQVTRSLLSEWGLELDTDIVKFTARCLEIEEIRFGRNQTYKSKDRPADWGSAVVRNPVLRTVSTMNNQLRIYFEYTVNNFGRKHLSHS